MLNKELKSKIYSYVINKLGLRDYRRGWLKGVCPDCGRQDKFGVNINSNRTNCFVCGYHPTPIGLVREMENLELYQDALVFLRAYEGRTYIEPEIERIERRKTILPESYKNLLVGDSIIGKSARRYVKSRGFNIDEMGYKGWGYCTSGKYFGYLIIPFYSGGNLIYYNARLFMGSGPKYNNPTIEEFGIGKSLIMYNIDALALYDEVYLTEGAINAETAGDQGISTGGKKVSHYQVSLILKSEVEKVNLLLDPDAIKDSIDLALEMSFHKKVRVIELPGDYDVNDLGYDKTMEIVNKIPFMDYKSLLKLKHA